MSRQYLYGASRDGINRNRFVAWRFCAAVLIFVWCGPRVRAEEGGSYQSDLGKIALQAEDLTIRLGAVSRLTDQALLARIVVEDKDQIVRRRAVEGLTDQASLARLAMEASHADVRERATEELTDQALLANLAFEDDLWLVRRAALKRLTDQRALARITVEDTDSSLRRAAMERITDLAILTRVAAEAWDIDLRKAGAKRLAEQTELAGMTQASLARVATRYDAASSLQEAATARLTDPTLLMKVFFENKDYKVRGTAVERLADQATLAKIAMKAESGPRASAAALSLIPLMEKITDQRLLAEIALTAQDSDIRRTAVGKLNDPELLAKLATQGDTAAVWGLTDQDLLARLALQGNYPDVCKIALQKLTDQALLTKVAAEAWFGYIRADAVQKLTDQSLLAKIVSEDELRYVRQAAAEKLTDQGVLAEVATQDKDKDVRRTATERLADESLLMKIFVEDKDPDVRLAAVKKLADPAVLAKAAAEDASPDIRRWAGAREFDVRVAAVKRLTDQAVLAKIAVDDVSPAIRQAATEGLTDQAALGKVAVEDSNVAIRCVAVGKLADQSLLAKLATEDKSAEVRQAAGKGLADQTSLGKIAEDAKLLDIFRIAAVASVTDQVLLREWAEREPRAAVRQTAVAKILDDDFLLARLAMEVSPSVLAITNEEKRYEKDVRGTIIETLHEKDSLRRVALTAYHREDREHALHRLQESMKDSASDVVAANRSLRYKVRAISDENDNDKLVTLAIEGEFDVLRTAAARRLQALAPLEQASLRATDQEVLMILLAKIQDSGSLNRIAASATDPSMRLASLRKSGAQTWEQIFNSATVREAPPRMLDNALGAGLLLRHQESSYFYSQSNAVDQACLNLIRVGDESRVQQLIDLLNAHGSLSLAEHYLDCGKRDLFDAAYTWAHQHGYTIKAEDTGSRGTVWGSNR